MKRFAVALAAALLVAAAPARDNGGKIRWTEPRSPRDFDALLAQANQHGRAILMCFTVDGCKACTALGAGAFSDDDVVRASEKLDRIMILAAGKNLDIWKRYGVSGAPTILFLSPDGKKVGEGGRDSAALIKQIGEVAEKHARAPKWAASEEAAVAAAKEGSKPLVIVYRDDKPNSERALVEFGALSLAELYDKAVWVQRKLDLKSDDAKGLGIASLPALWVVDVRVEDPKARVLKKVSLPKAGSALKSELGSLLKGWKKENAPKDEETPGKD